VQTATPQPRMSLLSFASVALVVLAQGCATSPCAPGQRIHHIVLCWLKEPGNETQRRQLIAASKTFESIPGVVSVTAGTAMPAARPIEDGTFDVGIVVTVPDKGALTAYQAHPIHQQAVTNTLIPLVRRIQVYDIKSD
jgi:hypothetical protein